MSYSFAFTLHLIAAVIWVGGMFFAHMVLRPSAVEKLAPPFAFIPLGGCFWSFFLLGLDYRRHYSYLRLLDDF